MEWRTGRNTLVEFCCIADCSSDYVDNWTVNDFAVFRRGVVSVYRRSIFGFTGVIYPCAFFLAYIADHVFIDGYVFIARLTAYFIDRALLNADKRLRAKAKAYKFCRVDKHSSVGWTSIAHPPRFFEPKKLRPMKVELIFMAVATITGGCASAYPPYKTFRARS